jgi:hypothetical protein
MHASLCQIQKAGAYFGRRTYETNASWPTGQISLQVLAQTAMACFNALVSGGFRHASDAKSSHPFRFFKRSRGVRRLKALKVLLCS